MASNSDKKPAANNNPVAGNDTVAASEDTRLVISAAQLLANDSDRDGDKLKITSVGAGSNCSVSIDCNGNIVVDPKSHFSGAASFSYTISDGRGGSSTATVFVNVAAVADAATLSVGNASGNEDGAIALTINAALTDTDGSESLKVVISGVPAGAALSAGTNNGNGTWTLTQSQLAGLKITPPANSDAGFDLTVKAISTEASNGSTAQTVKTLHVTVNAVADVPALVVTDAVGTADTAIALSVNANLVDTDGSESLKVVISGVPSGATLNHGTHNADGTWTLTKTQLSGLTITPPTHSDADFNLTVKAVSTESSNGSTANTQQTLHVVVNPAAPVLAVQDATGNEDTAIALNITVNGPDTTLVTISGVPVGATLNHGVHNADGTWTVTKAELAGLRLTPAHDSDADFNLSVSVKGSSSGNDDDDDHHDGDRHGNEGLGNGQDAPPPGHSYNQNDGPGTSRGNPGSRGGSDDRGHDDHEGDDHHDDNEDGHGTTITQTIHVTVNAVADLPTLTVADASGTAGNQIALNIAAALTDTDGSESLSIRVSGIPAGDSLSAGTRNADGSWTLNSAQLAGLKLVTVPGTTGDYSLTIAATSTEAENHSQSTNTATLHLHLSAATQPIVAAGDSAAAKEDSAATVTGNVLTNDGDPNAGGVMQVVAPGTIVGQYGTLTLAANGAYSYALNNSLSAVQALAEGQKVTETFAYQAKDQLGAISNSANLVVTITGTNDVAVIGGVSTGSVTEDVAVNVSGNLTTSGALTASDADVGQSSFTAQPSVAGQYGTFTLTANGAWTYTANDNQSAIQQLGANQSLTDSFTAVSSDGGTSQVVTVTINGTNDVAVIGGVSTGSVTEDVAVSNGNLTTSGALTASDADAGQSSFTAQPSVAGQYGTFTLAANGAWTYTANDNQSAIQQLGQGQSITDSFTAVSSDGGTSRVVTVTINGTNDVAVIGGVSTGSVTEDVAVSNGNLTTSGALTASDADAGQSSFTAQPSVAGQYGTFTLAANGAWTYTANDNQSAIQQLGQGQSITDSFTAVSSDGGTSQVVTVTINGTNDVAVIGGVSTGSVTEDVAVSNGNLTTSGALTASDADAGQSSFTAQPSVAGQYGTFTLAANGAWTYTANDNQSAIQQLGQGQSITDSFTAVSSDGGTSRVVTVTINGTNDAAVIGGVSTGSVTEDVAVNSNGNLTTSGALTVSDADANQSSFTAQPALAGQYGTFTLTANGAWTYTANDSLSAIQQLGANQSLTDSFTAVSSDGGTSRVVTVTINGTNDAAVLHNVVAVTDLEEVSQGGNWGFTSAANLSGGQWHTDNPGNQVEIGAGTVYGVNTSSQVIELEANTGDAANLFTNIAASAGSTFDLSFDYSPRQYYENNSNITIFWGGNVVGHLSGSSVGMQHYSLTLSAPADGVYRLEFRADDSNSLGGLLDNIAVGQTSGDIAASVTEQGTPAGNLSVSGAITFTDVDLADTHVVSATAVGSTLGSLTAVKNGDTTGSGTGGQLTWAYSVADALVENLAEGETKVENFTITLADQNGSVVTRNVAIVITGTNDAPVAQEIVGAVDADGAAATLTASYTDVDASDTHTFSLNTTATHGHVINNGDGTFSYDANGQFGYLAAGQTATDSFQYTVTDNHGGFSTQTATVTITGQSNNHAPVANNDTLAATEDTPVTYTAAHLLGNDTDAEGTALAIASVTSGSGGSAVLNNDGTVTFTPNANFNGTADFSYKATDGTLLSNSATVTVNVAAVNDAPTNAPVTLAAIGEDSGARLITQAELLANAHDIDSPSLTAEGLTIASGNGTLVDNGDGTWTYTPALNDDTGVSFSYTVTDGELSAAGSATLDITPVNDPATFTGDMTASLTETNAPQTTGGTLVANDVDGPNAFAAQTGAAGSNGYGQFSINAAGVWTYTMNSAQDQFVAGQDYTDSVTVATDDGTTQVLTVTITGTNDTPVIVSPTAISLVDTPLADHFAAQSGTLHGSDAESSPLTYGILGGTVNGATVSLASAYGTLTLNTATGDYTFAPNDAAINALTAGELEHVDFTVTAFDGLDTGSSTLTINLTGSNDDPTAASGHFTISEDTSLVLASDAEGDALSVVSVSGLSHGTVTVGTDGVVRYTPDHNYSTTVLSGPDSFTYTVSDGHGGQSTQSVQIDMTGVTDAPSLVLPILPIVIPGPEYLVNPTGITSNNSPSIAAFSDGTYVISWSGMGANWLQDIYAQRYTAERVAVGGLAHVSGATAGADDLTPSVTAFADGGYLIAWHAAKPADFQGLVNSDILAQRFDAQGAPAGEVIQINTASAIDQLNQTVAVSALDGGGFVAIWEGRNTETGSPKDIFARQYDALGNAVGGEFLVKTDISGQPGFELDAAPAVTAMAGGGYFATWFTFNPTSGNYEIEGQRFAADSSRVGGIVPIAFDTGSAVASDFQPSIATLDGGGMVMAWHQTQSDQHGVPFSNIVAQRIDAEGHLMGGQFTVTAAAPGHNAQVAAVSPLGQGGFVVSWFEASIDNQGNQVSVVHAQRFAPDGTAAGEQFRVDSIGGAVIDALPAVALLPTGDFMVSWNRGSGSESTIVARDFFPAFTTEQGTAVHLHVGAQLNDIDGSETLTLRVDGVTGGLLSFGAVQGDGSWLLSGGDLDHLADLTYTPITSIGLVNLHFVATAKELSLSNDPGVVDSGYVAIQALEKNLAPEIIAPPPDGYSTLDNASLTALLPVFDPNIGDTLTFILLNGPQAGTVELNLDGTFTYTPVAPYFSPDPVTFTFRATDSRGLAVEGEINITVDHANLPPVTTDSMIAMYAGADQTFATATFTATDLENTFAQLSFSEASAPHHGFLTFPDFPSTGHYIYTPNPGFFGTDSFTFTATDLNNGSTNGTVHIDVAPYADLSASQLQDTLVSGSNPGNQVSNGDQGGRTLVAVGGGFVATWESDENGTHNIYGQLYDANGGVVVRQDADGNPVSAPFLIGQGHSVALTATATQGGFDAVWIDATGALQGNHFDAAGGGGLEFTVATGASAPAVDTLPTIIDGNSLVVFAWASSDGIYVDQRTLGGDAVNGGPTLIAGTMGATAPSIAVLGDGSFFATWQQPGSHSGIQGAHYLAQYDFDLDGNVISAHWTSAGTVVIADGASADQTHPSVTALADGGYLVAWTGQDDDGSAVMAQRFDADGNAVDAGFVVNSTTTGDQLNASVTSLFDGGFMVAWTSNQSDSGLYETYEQRFDAAGNRVGGELQLSHAESLTPTAPEIAGLNDQQNVGGAGFAAIWNAGGDVHGSSFSAGGKAIVGTDGNDVIMGTLFLDYLDGGAGDDTLIAIAGNDTLIGGTGHNTLVGGAGTDTFVFNQNGFNTVQNFDAARDVLDLRDVLSAAANPGSINAGNLGDYVQEKPDGTLEVDPFGLAGGGPDGWTQVGMLAGAPSIDLADLLNHYQLLVAAGN